MRKIINQITETPCSDCEARERAILDILFLMIMCVALITLFISATDPTTQFDGLPQTSLAAEIEEQ